MAENQEALKRLELKLKKKTATLSKQFKRQDKRKAINLNMERQKEKKFFGKGFSLIEGLISLSLFLFIFLSSIEIFTLTRSHFLKLKDEEETNEAAYSALDKIRIDLLDGGLGLLNPTKLGLLESISEKNGFLTIKSREKELGLFTDLIQGQTRIYVGNTKNIKKGRKLCIFDSNKGEIKSISAIEKDSIILSSSLDSSYLKLNTGVILLREISLFLDKDSHILRRKVNSSPSQPLLEEVDFFDFGYQKDSNLMILRLCLNSRKEKTYEISVFPKNTALAFNQ